MKKSYPPDSVNAPVSSGMFPGATELLAILYSISDGVYIGGMEGITLVNKAALDQLGFTNREELNRHVGTLAVEINTRDAKTGEPIPADKQPFVRALNGEWVTQDVLINHRITKEERVLRCAASPVIQDGKIIAAIAINTDITEQRKAEAAMRDSKERQTFLLKLSDALRPLFDPIAIQDVTTRLIGEYLAVDHAYYATTYDDRKMAVIERDYVRDGSISLVGEYRYADFGAVINTLSSGEIFIAPDVVNMPEIQPQLQSYMSLNMRALIAIPLIKENKMVACLAVVSSAPRQWTENEISLIQETAERTWAAVERAHAERSLQNFAAHLEQEVNKRTIQLKESRDQLQSIFDTTLMQMSILSAVRDETGKILDLEIKAANKELEKETGRTDLVGKLYATEYPGIRETKLFDLIVETIETGVPTQSEFFYPFEGFNKWFSCMFIKFDDGVVATNINITARKQAEEERFKNYVLLQQSEDLARLGSWDFNLLTGVFTWSDGMYRLFDLKKGTKITPEIYLNYTTEAGRPAAERVVTYIKAGYTDFWETLELNIGGQIKILQLKATVITNNAQLPVRVLGVDMDVTASRKSDEKIRRMEADQQQEIFRVTLASQEEERRRISESLHNGLGQVLYAIKISMAHLTQKQALTKPKEYAETKLYTEQLLKDAIAESRRISHELMPSILEDFGLKFAINDICQQLNRRVKFTCKFREETFRLEKYMELAVFRITQELMLNVVKHSEATRATTEISIKVDEVLIRVQDNGHGITKQAEDNMGIGLASIRSRVKLLNGEVHIDSNINKGTIVTVQMPLPAIKT